MTARRIPILAAAALGVLMLAFAGSATARERDSNDDRIPDRWEQRHGLSLTVKQTRRDQDHDGLQNRSEFRSHTDPLDADSDGDGVEDAGEDRDGDGVDNYNEQDEGTKQNDEDSDDDGKSDGREDADHDGLNNKREDQSGNDPDDEDTDDDGIEDGDEQAGVIVSFEGTTLTLNVFGGGTLSGTVTDQTEIECETEEEHENGDESEDELDEGMDVQDRRADAADAESGGDRDEQENDLDEEEIGDEDNLCAPEDLQPGTLVHEAEIENGSFEEIELIK